MKSQPDSGQRVFSSEDDSPQSWRMVAARVNDVSGR